MAQANTGPTVYFAAPAGLIAQHSVFTVDVLVDTPKPINAVSVNVVYPPDRISLRSIKTNGSFIAIWRDISPVADSDGTVRFEGGAMASFSGSGGKIGTLVFEAITQGAGQLSFSKTDFYAADGTGSRIVASGVPLDITVASEEASSTTSALAQAPPPIINVLIADNPIGGYPLAAFRITDQGSGVQSIEIRFLQRLRWSAWQFVSKPVPIPPTAAAFQVRVLDSSGNSTQKTAYVWGTLLIDGLILAGIAIMAVVIGIVSFMAYRLWRRKKIVL
jgi:hypothetical protein